MVTNLADDARRFHPFLRTKIYIEVLILIKWGKEMIDKKIILSSIGFFLILAFLNPQATANTTTYEYICSQEQPRICYNITTNRDTLTSLFQIAIVKVTMKNLENESVSLSIGGLPGGGFFIINDNGKIINRYPRYFLLLLWEVTLQPGEEIILYQKTWFQNSILSLPVRNGHYHFYGITGTIYWNGQRITPDPFGPVNITVARRFLP
jgi:hypothetical protein